MSGRTSLTIVLAAGEGTRMLTVVGTPKPPKTDRRKAAEAFGRPGSEDQTL